MTYSEDMEKTETPVMPEFYLVQQGSESERYTSYSEDTEFLGYTWTAASIKRGDITRDNEMNVVTLSVLIPITDLISNYVPNQPIESTNITLYRSTIDDLTSYVIIFKGRVTSVILNDDGTAQIELSAANRILKRRVPKIIYQSFCNHSIFDTGCGLDRYTYQRTAQVTGLSDSNATIEFTYTDGGDMPDAGYYITGEVEIDGDFRYITGNDATDEITIHVPFDERLEVGSEILLYPGCDGDPETCVNTFDNLDNFLGMPYIPNTNPAIWGF